ncbi:MAG: hypothetical protein V4616_06775 [Bacteroidota bacterium]
MKTLASLLTLVVLCTSCATLFNGRYTRVTITTDRPAALVVNGDSLTQRTSQRKLSIKRDHIPLMITAYDDSTGTTRQVEKKMSTAYWMGYAFVPYNLLIDGWGKKKFTYPKNIYIDLDSTYVIRKQIEKPVVVKPPRVANRTESNILKFSPLKMVSLFNPGIELSYERKFSNHWSAEISGTSLLPVVFKTYPDRASQRGFGTSLQAKYYLDPRALMGMYFSAEFNYTQRTYSDKGEFYPNATYSDTTHFYYNGQVSRFTVKQQGYRFTLKFGYQYLAKSGFVADGFGGLGIRGWNTKHEDKPSPDDVLYLPKSYNPFEVSSQIGDRVVPEVTLNIRIGWIF